MVRSSLLKAHGDVAETKRRVSVALNRYGAFAGAVKRADVSAQASGAKVLESLASIAAQDQLLLRNSADLRRFFATALSKIDVAALLRSPSVPVQVAALRASNSLSQHVESLPSTSLPLIVKLLQSPHGVSELAVSTLRHLIRPFGPSIVWQTIHDGKGNEMLLARVEAWTHGGSSAAAHLRLLCYLLQSSLAAERQLFEDSRLAARWTSTLLQLLQQPLSESDAEVVAAAVRSVSSMSPFIRHVQEDPSKYSMLAVATAATLHSGNRLKWREGGSLTMLTNTACDLLDTIACITPPHVQKQQSASPAGAHQVTSTSAPCLSNASTASEDAQHSVAPLLAEALQVLLSQKRLGLQMHSAGHMVLSAALKAVCVLLLPPHFGHGSGAEVSPWARALSPALPSQLIGLLSKDGSDKAVDTWCWQALYLLQAHLSPSHIHQILQHPTAHKIPPTSILTLDPLYCSYSALRVILACKSATRHSPSFTQFCPPACGPHSNQQISPGPYGQGQPSGAGLSLQPETDRQQWPLHGQQAQRHHLLLPKALPQGNLSRYFDLACITAGLRCLSGQQDAWEDAWLVLKHALGNFATQDGSAWASAITASLQTLTEAGAMGCLPSPICQELLHLAHTFNKANTSHSATAALPSELAYGDISGGSGSRETLVPPPLQQQESFQLQLWWAAATAVCCGQLGLPSELGETMRELLADSSTADIAFELQDPHETVWAHAAVIAARCPKLYRVVLAQTQQQQQQQHQQTGYSAAQGESRLQLGKQVQASTFRQLLEFLYTGRVQTLSSNLARVALRKLAHALDLPQLAALAAGSRPAPGANYPCMSLGSLLPCGPTTIPWGSFMSDAECAQLQQDQQQGEGSSLTDAAGAAAVNVASGDAQISSEGSTEQQLHPALGCLTHVSFGAKLPAAVPAPAGVPHHVDVLLVPRQCRSWCACRPDMTQQDRPNEEQQAVQTTGGENAPGQVLGHDRHLPCCDVPAACQWEYQGLAAHRAVLAASSPYFAAMLSDRWQAGTQTEAEVSAGTAAHGSRQLPVAKLPTQDMDVVFAFVHFCYTRELSLRLLSSEAWDICCHPTESKPCRRCWQARTAVRLSAAAESWMVPALQQQCLHYLSSTMSVLPLECQAAVHSDMVELQTWDLSAIA